MLSLEHVYLYAEKKKKWTAKFTKLSGEREAESYFVQEQRLMQKRKESVD